MATSKPINIVCTASDAVFLSDVYPKRDPAILRGLHIGACMQKWSLSYLCNNGGDQEVKIHVSSTSSMDFINKNFLYRSLPFKEFVKRASQENHEQFFIDKTEKYYLRALGNDPRKDVANIATQFPDLAADVCIPKVFDKSQFFSSVFRIASKGLQLWTHYDVMDNLLIQVIGKKKVVMFPPEDVDYLYMSGDKSRVLDVDNPDLDKFPKFSQARRFEGYLEPGDVLFIPALWFHNMTYEDFGVAVNVFWRHLDPGFYDTKDPYGNKDLLPAQRASQIVDRALKALEELPPVYRDFYARRLCDRVRTKCCGGGCSAKIGGKGQGKHSSSHSSLGKKCNVSASVGGAGGACGSGSHTVVSPSEAGSCDSSAGGSSSGYGGDSSSEGVRDEPNDNRR